LDKAPDAFRIISEVAEDLDLPQHVLRFWESRFAQIKPMKRGGGRRYYRPDDVDLLRGIRYLLYSEGYTIRGVQRILREHGARFVQAVWQEGAPQPPRGPSAEGGEDNVRTGPRGLLGLLPGFRHADAKSEVPAVDEATASEAARTQSTEPTAPAIPASSVAALGPEQLRTLRIILDDLVACRSLIEAAVQ